MTKINRYLIFKNKTIKDTINLIDKNGEKTCFVVDEKKRLIGSVTDGDIRRNILKKRKSLSEKIHKFCNKKTKFILEGRINQKRIKHFLLDKRIEILPIIDKDRKITLLKFRSEILSKKQKSKKQNNKSLSKINVVVMAGGKGERLDPITRIFPKPLVPIKDKTVLENIIENFINYGVRKFFFTLNFKSDLIKAYFNNKPKIKRKINYISEHKPLGTAGGLQKLQKKISKNFIVSNCDVIFDMNYEKLIKFHIRSKNDLTIVVSKQKTKIPYGVCKIDNNNELINIEEKPQFNYLITTGLYVFNSKILKLIPKDKYLDMNKFIEKMKKANFKVRTFKIGQKNWYDIGQLQEYKKKLELLSV